MIVRELLTRLGFQLDNAAINRAEQATNRIRDRADVAANAFRNIALAIGSIATVQGLIKIGDTMQSIRARIEQLPQTVMEAGEAFDVVADHAIAARAPIEAYAGLYNRLGNAAKDYVTTQEDLLGITDTISKALVVGGATAQEAGSVMIQFSQALGAGTLQGEEFRAMAEAAPQYMDQLALALGKPRSELKKLASEGKITSKDVIEATRKMAVYFDDKFKKMPMTVGQAMIIVNDRFARMIDRMNRESMFITKIADTIIKGFDAIESGIESVIKAFDGWENAIRFIGIALGLTGVVLASFGTISWAALLPWVAIGAAILLAAAIIEDILVMLDGGESVTGRILEKFKEWGTAIEEGMASAETAVLETIVGWSKALYDMFVETIPRAVRDAFNYVKGLPMEIWNGITSGANTLSQGANMGNVSPSSIGGSSNSNISVDNRTNVTVTVPAGTPAEQVSYLERAAKQSFADSNRPLRATDMATHSP